MRRNPRRFRPERLAAFAVVLTICGTTAAWSALPGEDAPSAIRLTGDGEPGTPLVVEGTVFRPDGVTPAPGVVLYVYQTGLDGLYHSTDGAPRLRGYMKTDEHGRFSYRSIRPGSYPKSTIPAHVHTQLWGGGFEPQWNRDLLFADDPFVRDRDRSESDSAGRFGWICAPRRDAAGVLHCTHDLRLKSEGDRFEPATRHGLDGPRRD
ncbi:MAG: hypothetical protein AB7G12_02615 [Thermoanaerobaculia bacterium]